MFLFIDQLGSEVNLKNYPCRIISLVPSQTELLFDLGLGDKVIGITKFCIHPEEWFQQKTRIGGTKNVSIEKVKALQPDLIIGNKEENTREDILELEKIAPVWMSDVLTLEDNYSMIKQIGEITNTIDKATEIIQDIKLKFERFAYNKKKISKELSVLYLIWKNPYMAAAQNTIIHDLMMLNGWKNFMEHQVRYPIWDSLKSEKPDVILLSSEPYPFKKKDVQELKAIFPSSLILKVDGELFSWYGSRLKHAPSYFLTLNSLLQTSLESN